MLALFFLISYTSIGMLITGIAIRRLLFGDYSIQHPVIHMLVGVAFQLMIAQVLVLFMPVDIVCSVAINLASFGLFLRSRRPRLFWPKAGSLLNIRKWFMNLLCLIIIAGPLILISAGPTMMDDTDSYHLQIIAWMHEWGTVPGLANLHLRYGFHSSWLTGAALFSWPSPNNYYTVLNGALSVWLVWYLLFPYSLNNDKDKHAVAITAASRTTLLVGLLIWALIRKNSSTTNYDFITTVCTIVLFLEVLKKGKESEPPIEWLILPVFLVTVRLMNFPLLLLSLNYLWQRQKLKSFKSHRSWLVITGLVIGMTVPFIARNYILSGFPFFPSMAFSILQPDWRADPDMVSDILRYIKYFNRVNTMYMNIEETTKISTPAWVLTWFKYLFTFDKIIIVGGTLGLICIIGNKKLNRNRMLQAFMAAIFAHLALWFMLAPDPRFIYGVFLCGLFSGFYMAYFYLNDFFTQKAASLIFLASAIFIQAVTIKNLYSIPDFRNIVRPFILPVPETEVHYISDQKLVIPKRLGYNWNPRCYNLTPPCLYEVDLRLGLRGNTIKQGFNLKSPKSHLP